MDSQLIQVPVALPIWLYVSLLVVVAVLGWIRRVVTRIEKALNTPATPYRCPDCAEPVREEARICKFCRCELTTYFAEEAQKVAQREAEALDAAEKEAERLRLVAEQNSEARNERRKSRRAAVEKIFGKKLLNFFVKSWKQIIATVAVAAVLVGGAGFYLRQNPLQAAQVCAALNDKELPSQFGYVADVVAISERETLQCTLFLLSGYLIGDTLSEVERIPGFSFTVTRYSDHAGRKLFLIRKGTDQ